LAKDSILQKQRRRFLVLCAKFCGASLIIQSVENEIFQAQTCTTNPLRYEGYCVVTNEDLSSNVLSICNILKAANAVISFAAGV
jgi:hypothetical protein